MKNLFGLMTPEGEGFILARTQARYPGQEAESSDLQSQSGSRENELEVMETFNLKACLQVTRFFREGHDS